MFKFIKAIQFAKIILKIHTYATLAIVICKKIVEFLDPHIEFGNAGQATPA